MCFQTFVSFCPLCAPLWVPLWAWLNALSTKDEGSITLSCLSKVSFLSIVISERMFVKGCSSRRGFRMHVLSL